MTMSRESRVEPADKLNGVIQDYLSLELCTGTGKDFKERRQEMVRLMAQVTAAVLCDGQSVSEQAFKAKTLENKVLRACERQGHHVWLVDK